MESNIEKAKLGSLIIVDLELENKNSEILNNEKIVQCLGYICWKNNKKEEQILAIPTYNKKNIDPKTQIIKIHDELLIQLETMKKFKEWSKTKLFFNDYEFKFFFINDNYCFLCSKRKDKNEEIQYHLINISEKQLIPKNTIMINKQYELSNSKIKTKEIKKFNEFCSKDEDTNIELYPYANISQIINLVLFDLYPNISLLDNIISNLKKETVKYHQAINEAIICLEKKYQEFKDDNVSSKELKRAIGEIKYKEVKREYKSNINDKISSVFLNDDVNNSQPSTSKSCVQQTSRLQM